jgi:HlyD family secretion protein
VDAGTKVKKDEKVMELDASGLQESLQLQNIDVSQAKSAEVQADEDYGIQEIENKTDIASKKNAFKLAEIDLEKYEEGDYPQAEKDVLGRIQTAKSDLESWKDRAAWSARMVKKGLMSKVQAEADQSKLEAAQIALQKVEEELRVLTKYTKPRTIRDLKSKLNEAELNLKKAESQAKSKLAQKDAARLSARSVHEQKLSKKKEIEGEITKCQIYAPQDGLVVYYVPDQVRGGGGQQQSIVAQGEPVREGQKMLQIPDLSKMLVNVRVHEAMVAHLYKRKRQPAEIRVEAFPHRTLKGHVKFVDTVASQQDWFSADVKVYKTLVTIDESMEGLKPGMSAEVAIYAEETTDPVLVVPVQAVVGTISMGAERKCFVIGPDGQPRMRDIIVGMSNERLVEVKSGLQEGERVVQNPQPLLDSRSEMKPGRVRGRGDEGGEKAGGEGGPKGKKGGGEVPGGFKGPKGPKGPVGEAPGPGGPPADAQQQMQALMQRLQAAATPEQRRDIINAGVPAEFRERVREAARSKGMKVAD